MLPNEVTVQLLAEFLEVEPVTAIGLLSVFVDSVERNFPDGDFGSSESPGTIGVLATMGKSTLDPQKVYDGLVAAEVIVEKFSDNVIRYVAGWLDVCSESALRRLSRTLCGSARASKSAIQQALYEAKPWLCSA